MNDVVNNMDLSLLNVGFANHHADWNFGPVCSAVTRLYWTVEGNASVTFHGKTHPVTPGHLYIIPAFVSHYDHCDGVFRHFYIHVADTSQQIVKLFDQYDLPFALPVKEQDKMIFNRLLDLCPNMSLPRPKPDTYETSSCYLQYSQRFNALPLGVKMEIKGLLMLLLSRFFSEAHLSTTVSDERIIRIQRMIERDLGHVPSVGEMASNVSLCKDRFIRLFHKETGTTPTDYVIRRRILRAQILLSTSSHSVKQIAADLGFANASYFGRMFNKVTGMPPMAFKRQNV